MNVKIEHFIRFVVLILKENIEVLFSINFATWVVIALRFEIAQIKADESIPLSPEHPQLLGGAVLWFFLFLVGVLLWNTLKWVFENIVLTIFGYLKNKWDEADPLYKGGKDKR